MPNPYFSFKQFTVYHDKCAMKVGIDGVLLGSWADVSEAKQILDIGTGTGLIALMIAQRNNEALVDAIDIDAGAVLQATENVRNSPWSERIRLYEVALQNFDNVAKYDLIVSNPPYFVNSTKAPEEDRTTARHTDSLAHEELILNSKKHLLPSGKLCIILPVNEGLQCVEFAAGTGLYCSKQVTVFPKPGAAAKRLLLEFTLRNVPTEYSDLTIESEHRHHYSPEFTQLAKEFYLKL